MNDLLSGKDMLFNYGHETISDCISSELAAVSRERGTLAARNCQRRMF